MKAWLACQEPERRPDTGMYLHHGVDGRSCFGCCLKYETGLRMFNAENPDCGLNFEVEDQGINCTAFGRVLSGAQPWFANHPGDNHLVAVGESLPPALLEAIRSELP